MCRFRLYRYCSSSQDPNTTTKITATYRKQPLKATPSSSSQRLIASAAILITAALQTFQSRRVVQSLLACTQNGIEMPIKNPGSSMLWFLQLWFEISAPRRLNVQMSTYLSTPIKLGTCPKEISTIASRNSGGQDRARPASGVQCDCEDKGRIMSYQNDIGGLVAIYIWLLDVTDSRDQSVQSLRHLLRRPAYVLATFEIKRTSKINTYSPPSHPSLQLFHSISPSNPFPFLAVRKRQPRSSSTTVVR